MKVKKVSLLSLALCLVLLLNACTGTAVQTAADAQTATSADATQSASVDDTQTSENANLSGYLEVGTMLAEGTSSYDFTVGVADELIADNPDLDIELIFANRKARAFIDQRWRSDDGPDTDYFVFNAQVPATYEFTEYLLDLTPYLEADPEWRDSFINAAATITTLDGATYGLITDTHVLALYYNKACFEQYGITPPTTWTELLAACETLKTNGIDPIALTGTFTPYMGMWLDYLMIREVGYDVAAEAVKNGKLSENPAFLRAAQNVQTLVDNDYLLDGFEGTDFTAAQMQFFQGKTGMILMGTWLSSEMADSIPDDFQLGIIPFPAIEGSEADQSETLSHSNVMSINKDSDNLDAAIAFTKLFTSVDVQTRRAQECQLISAVKGVPAPTGTYGLDNLISGIGSMYVRWFGLEFEEDKNTAYYNEVAKLFFGEYTAEEFIANADAAMQALN
jgi:raffinose/stachyose/melibiose transport system substrate-binding protein